MHTRRFVSILVATAMFPICGCVRRLPASDASQSASSFPLAKTQPDHRPTFSFMPSSPFHLEFGRGSGREGLDTFATDETGRAVLHRCQFEYRYHLRHGRVLSPFWERAELKLSDNSIQRLTKAVQDLPLSEMARAYHADVSDGIQWIFWLQQRGREKSVYFDNHFPKVIQAFAALLDAELQRAGIATVKWRRVSKEKERDHETAIWNSIEDGA